jgi:hypothetical protein
MRGRKKINLHPRHREVCRVINAGLCLRKMLQADESPGKSCSRTSVSSVQNCWAWWLTTIISALRRLGRAGHDFKASLGSIETTYLQKKWLKFIHAQTITAPWCPTEQEPWRTAWGTLVSSTPITMCTCAGSRRHSFKDKLRHFVV